MKRYLVLYTVVFGALAVVIGLAARREAREGAPPVPSTYILGSEGYRAAWRLLEDMGVPVARNFEPFDALPDTEGNLLILAAPRARPVTELEASSLKAWVATGNSVLWLTALGDPRTYAGGFSTESQSRASARDAEGKLAWIFDAGFEYPDSGSARELERYLPVSVATSFTGRIHELYVGPCVELQVNGKDWLTLAGSQRGASVRLLELGRGRIWLSPTPHLLDNGGLIRGDNVLFLRNLALREVRGGTVLFDEYHHGYSLSPLGSISHSPVFRTVLLQGGLLFLFYLWSRARRFGPAIPLERDPRRPAIESLHAMAEMFRRGGKSQDVAAGLVRGFRGKLERKLAVGRGLPAREAVRALEVRSGRAWPELQESLEAFARGEVDRPRHLLRLARTLRAAERSLGD